MASQVNFSSTLMTTSLGHVTDILNPAAASLSPSIFSPLAESIFFLQPAARARAETMRMVRFIALTIACLGHRAVGTMIENTAPVGSLTTEIRP